MRFEGAVQVDRERIKQFLEAWEDIWDKQSNYLSKDFDLMWAI